MQPAQATGQKKRIALWIVTVILLFQTFTLGVLFIRKFSNVESKRENVIPAEEWRKLAETAFSRGDYSQTIYFYEKTLAAMHEKDESREQIQKRLLELSHLNHSEQSRRKDSPMQDLFVQDDWHRLLSLAEEAYEKGEYRAAKTMYYTLLLESDRQKEQRIITDIHFRIHQCSLLETIEVPSDDIILKDAVELIK